MTRHCFKVQGNLFVFGRIILLIIHIRPNSKDALFGTALVQTICTLMWSKTYWQALNHHFNYSQSHVNIYQTVTVHFTVATSLYTSLVLNEYSIEKYAFLDRLATDRAFVHPVAAHLTRAVSTEEDHVLETVHTDRTARLQHVRQSSQ